MSKIVTQDKLNELVNAEIDLGKGGGGTAQPIGR